MASSVPLAICERAVSPVRSWWRSRNSITVHGGNFGAPPNPPARASYCLANVRTAPARIASSVLAAGIGRPAPAPLASADPTAASWAVSSAAYAATSSGRSRQASVIAVRICANDGIPCRGSGGSRCRSRTARRSA